MPARTTFGTRGVARTAPPAVVARELAPSAPGDTQDQSVPAACAKPLPFLTLGLTLALAALYSFELQHRVDVAPPSAMDARSLVALGGISRYLVFENKEWWRLFTAPWLHAGLSHLIGNGVTLVLAGVTLERLVGRAWLAALFVLGGAAGSVGSLVFMDATVSVGASGALMCLVTAMLALSHHFESGARAGRMRRRALAVIIPALAPSAAAAQIDVGAHFGGFLAGLLLGFFLLIVWQDERPSPPLKGIAAGIALSGLALAGFAALEVRTHYARYAAESVQLVPLREAQGEPQHMAENATALLARYPRDPLLKLQKAVDFANHGDFGDAEREAREGLTEREILSTQFAPIVRRGLVMLLAVAEVAQGQTADAKAEAVTLCERSSDPLLTNGRLFLERASICS